MSEETADEREVIARRSEYQEEAKSHNLRDLVTEMFAEVKVHSVQLANIQTRQDKTNGNFEGLKREFEEKKIEDARFRGQVEGTLGTMKVIMAVTALIIPIVSLFFTAIQQGWIG